MSHAREAYPLAVKESLRLADLHRFLGKVESLALVEGFSPCWLWAGTMKKGSGYGEFHYQGGSIYAHRFAYAAMVGDIPNRMTVHHECEQKRCVNPAHLSLDSLEDHGARHAPAGNGKRWNRKSANDLPV